MCVTPSLVVFSSITRHTFSHAVIINNLLTGEVVGVSTPSGTRLNCIFLSGFTGSVQSSMGLTQPT